MKGIIDWVVKHPTLVNLLMVAICVMGLVSINTIPKEVFPESALDMIIVRMAYRGAGPKEIENGILLKIEDATQSITGIAQISSEAKENIAAVRIEVASNAKTARVLRDVKDQIDQISSFPADADKPAVYEVVRKTPVTSLALYGDVSRASLQTIAERIKDKLLEKAGIDDVVIDGKKEREISIEIQEAKLRKYNLQIADIGRALSRSNFDLSGGTLKTKKEDFILRIYNKKYLAKDLENITVKTLAGGTVIRIRDIASARETFADTPQAFFYNGKRALLVNVMRTSRGNSLYIGEQATAFLKEAKAYLPPNVQIKLQRDYNTPLRDRIALLMKNGIQGLFLVLITLSLLMNLRLAFWVAVGLPISMLGTFILLNTTVITINVLSLFGLILVIGILVDDAIVVAENVYSHLEAGKSPMRAAIDGTVEVIPAVSAAVFTTILAFSPLFFMGGLIGKFIFAIPGVVCLALLLSLIEGFLILPPHLAHSLKPKNNVEHTNNRLRQFLDGAFSFLNDRMYAGTLSFALRNRWPVLAVAISIFLVSIGMMRGGFVRFVFFPRIDSDQIVARIVMKPGTPRTKTKAILDRIERVAKKIGDDLKKKHGKEIILSYSTWIGKTTKRTPGFSPPTGEEVGEVQLELLNSERRGFSSYPVIDQWRKKVGPIVGAIQVNYNTLGGPPLGRALEFQLLSNNDKQLHYAANFLGKKLSKFNGVYDVENDLKVSKRELRFKLTQLAKSLGITIQELAFQIRYRITGQEVMRLQRGRDEVRVYVRYPESDRKSIGDLKDMWFQTRQGKRIPLTQLATWKMTRDLEVVRRIDRKRMASVYANMDDTKTSRQEIIQDLNNPKDGAFALLKKQAPEVRFVAAGQGREQAKVFGGMRIAFPVMIFGIFIILVAIFQSYSQAFLILSVVPFGIIGAIFGHMLMGIPLTILSFFGLVGLSGMVVNDSLVLMDKLNRLIVKDKLPIFQAAWQAGQSRLRAILSTTLTTFAGLAPLLLEKSTQAQFLIPMAVSIAFGIVFATFITLVLVPSLYLITDDIRCFVHWMKTGHWPTLEEVDPAVKIRKQLEEFEAHDEHVEYVAPPSA